MNNVRYVYGLTSALLVGGAAISLMTGYPAGAQVAQNDDTVMNRVVPVQGAPASFADLTQQLQPAVVNIATRQSIEVSRNPLPGSPFAELFNRRGGSADEPQRREAQSLGSGFIISADGYVVTNNHVIAPNERARLEEITITMPDGTEYAAELVGADEQSDLAVLKIQSDKAFPFVEFGDSSQTRVGEWVVAIGNPFGLGGTVTSGIVSAVYRNTGQGGAYDRFIQTDASINRGNSGGPLFDMRGNVIGINNAIFSPSGGSVGIGFAIPAEIAAPIVAKLQQGQEIERGYLGVSLEPINEDLADALDLPHNRGELVQIVGDDSPAGRAGLKPGDVIVSVNGREVSSEQTVSYIVANIVPGESVPVVVVREGRRMTIEVTLERRDESKLALLTQTFDPEAETPINPETSDEMIADKLGLQVLEMNAQIARSLGVREGTTGLVIGAVDPNSDAARRGLRRGDIILSANYQSVSTIEELREQIAASEQQNRDAILLRTQRRGQPPIFRPIRLR